MIHRHYQKEYDQDFEIYKLSRDTKKKKPSLLNKAYGYLLLIVFILSVSTLDSVSLIPTIVLIATIILGTIYLYRGGHLDGR